MSTLGPQVIVMIALIIAVSVLAAISAIETNTVEDILLLITGAVVGTGSAAVGGRIQEHANGRNDHGS